MSDLSLFRDRVMEVLEDFVRHHSLRSDLIYVAATIVDGSESVRLHSTSLEDHALDPQIASAISNFERDNLLGATTLSQIGDTDLYLRSLLIDRDLTGDLTVAVHVVMDRPPASRLAPRYLRQLGQTLEIAIADLQPPSDLESLEMAYLAARARVLPVVLRTIARCCNAEGALLWSYDFHDERYRSTVGFGPVGRDFILRLAGVDTPEGTIQGIVSQAQPGVPLVVYSVAHPELRVPKTTAEWRPHDPSILSANSWDACVAWPVVADGELLGAISIYGKQLADLSYSRRVRNACSVAVAEPLRAAEMKEELRSSEQAFEDELSKNQHGRLAGELVHDYKSSLETIEAFFRNLDPSRMPTAMQTMHLETLEAVSYLKDVNRTLSKLAKGQRSTGSTDLASVAHESESFLRALVRNENSSAVLRLSAPRQTPRGQSCSVAMDDLTAMRVMSNLVHNAATWTRGADHPEIDLSVKAADLRTSRSDKRSAPPVVTMTVSDNGPGVPREDAERIFSRGWSSRKADGGSGLGLYIVRKAVEDAGGTVVEVGRLGLGATFEIRLPCADA